MTAAGFPSGRLTPDEWRAEVSARLADPESIPFLGSVPLLFVLGGRHTDGPYCWCQPRYEEIVCPKGHSHTRTRHRDAMD